MKKPSEYVKIPRRVAEELLNLSRQVGNMDRTERVGLTSAECYAHALGKANSLGKEIQGTLEVYVNA